MGYRYEDETRLKYFKSIVDAVGWHDFRFEDSAKDLIDYLKPYNKTSAGGYKHLCIDGEVWIIYRLTDKDKAERFRAYLRELKEDIEKQIKALNEDIEKIDKVLEKSEVI